MFSEGDNMLSERPFDEDVGPEGLNGYEITCDEFEMLVVDREGVPADELPDDVEVDPVTGEVKAKANDLEFKIEAHLRVCEGCSQLVGSVLDAMGIDSSDELRARLAAQDMTRQLDQERRQRDLEERGFTEDADADEAQESDAA